jgi:phosphoglycolate phosphatase-like HAD superfamily hydrolase
MTNRSLAVFDIDGTLSDSVPLHQTAFLSVMEGFSFPSLNRDWASYTHHTDTAIFEEAWSSAYGRRPSLEERAEFHIRLESEFEETGRGRIIAEIAGAAAFVEHLRNAGWAVAFATGGLRKMSRRKLTAIGVKFADDLLVTASEYVTREELVVQAIEAARIHYAFTPGRVVSIGDGIWDLKTAAALGLHFLGVGTGSKAEILASAGATVVSDFRDRAAATASLQQCGLAQY